MHIQSHLLSVGVKAGLMTALSHHYFLPEDDPLTVTVQLDKT